MPPSTPPPLYEEGAWTPRTPRFAPIDEPDDFAPKKTLVPLKTPKKNGELRQTRLDVPSAHVVPLTPAQTPVNRKEVVEAIDGMQSSARVLFPSHTPARGSGRTVRRGIPTTPRGHQRGSSHGGGRFGGNGSGIVPMTPLSQSVKKRTVKLPQEALESARPRKLFSELEDARPRRLFEVFNDQAAAKKEADGEQELPESSEPMKRTRHNHPYQPLDSTKQPGMWYIFRGKKVFRPFGPNSSEDLGSLKPRRLFADKLDAAKGILPVAEIDSHNSEEDDTDVETTTAATLDLVQ